MRALREFVDAQTAYFVSAAARAQQLQSLVREKGGDLNNSSSFPRRDSITNNVPVADILKVLSTKIYLTPFFRRLQTSVQNFTP